MNIAFYSTNSNYFNGNTVSLSVLPSYQTQWETLVSLYPDAHFFVITQLPGMFLLDITGCHCTMQTSAVSYYITKSDSADAIADEIAALKPDMAIAATFWTAPFDWAPLKDCMIGALLRQKGITVLCHDVESAAICFDKYRTHQVLEAIGCRMPKAVYVHHELFWCERGKHEVRHNVYKEYILGKIKQLHYPVIIKETVGLSSYRMEVVTTYKQAYAYLSSGKNTSDHIVEEYIAGEQFGVEIHGTPGRYTVLPPFLFSVNKYGITSPKQSVKIGPIHAERYHIHELNRMLIMVAEKLQFSGIAQVDLVFSNGSWYIIEINPRLSGMTQTYACAADTSIHALLLSAAGVDSPGTRATKNFRFVCNFKMPIVTEEQMRQLFDLSCILYVSQIHNSAAKQEREKGYCEIIFGARATAKELLVDLQTIADTFPALIEPVFFENASHMIDTIADL
ncbi:MAG: ATP-grasp domain-containing protein [Treponema sp.]|nr:ATP-grasp domain-containing protein [Treponema sp.]